MKTQIDDYAAFIAIDWADKTHVFRLQAAGTRRKELGQLEQSPEVIGGWVTQLRDRFRGQLVAIAVEQSRGALIHALMSYDFIHIYPIHPTTLARFRAAFKSSGAKSDPLDADGLLEILTKHLDWLTPLRPDSEQSRLLDRLNRDRRKIVDHRTSTVQALTASLKEYFPQAIEILNKNLTSRMACDFLKRWPTLQKVQQAKPETIRKFLYGHNVRSAKRIAKVLELIQKARPLTDDPAILESGSRLSQVHAEVIATLNPSIEEYERRIKEVFQNHPEAHLFDRLPGAGDVMAPRLAAVFGTDRSRYADATALATFAGIAPVTKRSGKSEVVYFRRACPKFMRQTFHEFARLSVAECQWAKNYFDYYTDTGKKRSTVIRELAFKWIRILFRCWQTRTPYDEALYMATLKRKGSPFATLHLQRQQHAA